MDHTLCAVAPKERPADRAAAGAAGFIELFIPILVAKPPTGPRWLREIKLDGYRLIVSNRGDRVRLFTRRGYD
jgi:bifunctional non-homologous end joining protein LigD